MNKLIVILCIALSGCMYQSVNLSDIEAASKACGGLNQISELSADFTSQESVICFNREKYGLESRRVR